jgi:hypothetical protein
MEAARALLRAARSLDGKEKFIYSDHWIYVWSSLGRGIAVSNLLRAEGLGVDGSPERGSAAS